MKAGLSSLFLLLGSIASLRAELPSALKSDMITELNKIYQGSKQHSNDHETLDHVPELLEKIRQKQIRIVELERELLTIGKDQIHSARSPFTPPPEIQLQITSLRERILKLESADELIHVMEEEVAKAEMNSTENEENDDTHLEMSRAESLKTEYRERLEEQEQWRKEELDRLDILRKSVNEFYRKMNDRASELKSAEAALAAAQRRWLSLLGIGILPMKLIIQTANRKKI